MTHWRREACIFFTYYQFSNMKASKGWESFDNSIAYTVFAKVFKDASK